MEQKWSIHAVISEEKNKRQKILATWDFEDSITIDPFFYTQAGSQFSIRIHPQDRSTAVETASLENRRPHWNSFNRIPLMARSLMEAIMATNTELRR